MSKKQEATKYNKFYHNDIKKQLGIDQTRTASQKLLDKVIKVDKRADFYLTQNHQDQIISQPKKKIKPNTQTQTEPPQSNLQILQTKLMKNIENQVNITKLLKSLSILKKCLNQQSFLEDQQINFIQNWKVYANKLINQINEKNYFSSESFNIMTNIGDCIEILHIKFGKNCSKSEGGQRNYQEVQSGQNSEAISGYQVWISFCGLFTDDSFIFNKNLNRLKNFIFTQFNGTIQFSEQQKQLVLILINKLVSMPVRAQWAHSQLVKLFKEFNNNGYQNGLQERERKAYLRNYNELLSKKPKSSFSQGSYNIMGNPKQSTGLKTIHVQSTLQSSSDKWVSKQ